MASAQVSNTSVNPARSTATAVFQHGWALAQLWLFWLAPIVGAAIAGATYAVITGERRSADVSGAEGSVAVRRHRLTPIRALLASRG